MIEQVIHGDEILAVIIRGSFKAEGVHFFTPDTFSQQLGYMNWPAGHQILPHTHNPVQRTIEWTQEALFIRSGKVRLDIYDQQRTYLKSTILLPGDMVLLSHGGHGLVMLEKSEIIEVKQGPYAGEADKIRFTQVADADVVLS